MWTDIEQIRLFDALFVEIKEHFFVSTFSYRASPILPPLSLRWKRFRPFGAHKIVAISRPFNRCAAGGKRWSNRGNNSRRMVQQRRISKKIAEGRIRELVEGSMFVVVTRGWLPGESPLQRLTHPYFVGRAITAISTFVLKRAPQ